MTTPQNLTPHEVRMVGEHSQLSQRLSHLIHFFDTPEFAECSEAEKSRMKSQEMFMSGYASVLSDRIQAVFLAKGLPG
jgi:hypothetical protein